MLRGTALAWGSLEGILATEGTPPSVSYSQVDKQKSRDQKPRSRLLNFAAAVPVPCPLPSAIRGCLSLW